jgi:hypothetical protein
MPQETAPVSERETSWRELSERIRQLHAQGGQVVVAGDLNAKTGEPRNLAEKKFLGANCVGVASPNGRLLVDMLVSRGLVNTAGFVRPPKPTLGWVTRVEPGTGAPSRQLDYILVSSTLHRQMDAKFSVEQKNMDSDHFLVRAYVRCSKQRPQKKKDRKITRFRIERLREKAPKGEENEVQVPADSYKRELASLFEPTYEPAAVADRDIPGISKSDAVVKDFISRMNTALENSVGSKTVSKRYSRAWFDSEVREAIEERRAAYSKFKSSRLRSNWEAYRRLRRKVRRLVREKKEADWEKLIEGIGEDCKLDPKRMWARVKRVIGHRKGKLADSAVKREDGTLAFSPIDKKEAWRNLPSWPH